MSKDGTVRPKPALRGTERAQAPAASAVGLGTCRSSQAQRPARVACLTPAKSAGSTRWNLVTESERAPVTGHRRAMPSMRCQNECRARGLGNRYRPVLCRPCSYRSGVASVPVLCLCREGLRPGCRSQWLTTKRRRLWVIDATITPEVPSVPAKRDHDHGGRAQSPSYARPLSPTASRHPQTAVRDNGL
jgi:hypothetical protein